MDSNNVNNNNRGAARGGGDGFAGVHRRRNFVTEPCHDEYGVTIAYQGDPDNYDALSRIALDRARAASGDADRIVVYVFYFKRGTMEAEAAEEGDMPIFCWSCGRVGHYIWQCARAGADGFMPKCPLCAGEDHGVDSCEGWGHLSLQEKVDLVVNERAMKPQWKTENLWWIDLAKEGRQDGVSLTSTFPWSLEFSLAFLSRPDYEEKMCLYEKQLDSGYLGPDPLLVTEQAVTEYFTRRKRAHEEAKTSEMEREKRNF